MGGAMTPDEFIRENIKKELERMGVPFANQLSLADEGVRYWRQQARFKKGAWQDTIAYIKKLVTKQPGQR